MEGLRRLTNKPWLQRFGVLGFSFFLLKGLMWLALPALIAYCGSR